jgi:hypothetical protein
MAEGMRQIRQEKIDNMSSNPIAVFYAIVGQDIGAAFFGIDTVYFHLYTGLLGQRRICCDISY